MTIRNALLAAGLLAVASATPVFAQSNATIEGTASAPGNASGAPSAATTVGNLATTTIDRSGMSSRSTANGPLDDSAISTSSSPANLTPGAPSNTGK